MKKRKKDFYYNLSISVIVLLSFAVFILLFALGMSGKTANNTDEDTTIETLFGSKNNEKLNIDSKTLKEISGFDCEEIKKILGTNNNACIYFKDKDGRLMQLDNGKYGIGCEGLTLEGNKIC